jgi:hypothetical protein
VSDRNGQETVILTALEQALRTGGEVRLISSGKSPRTAGLFADRTEADRCLREGLLREVRSEEAKSGKAMKNHSFVVITDEGVRFLAARRGAGAVSSLVSEALREARKRLARAEEERAESEHRVKQLERFLLPEPPRPATEDEFRYQRWLAQHMIFALEEVRGTPVAEPIERALFNAGVRPIGHRDERAEFDPRLHDAEGPIAPGESVRIVESGWLVLDDLGEFVLCKAKVRASGGPVPPESE